MKMCGVGLIRQVGRVAKGEVELALYVDNSKCLKSAQRHNQLLPTTFGGSGTNEDFGMEMFCDAVSIATGLRCWVGCERESGLETKCEEDDKVDEH